MHDICISSEGQWNDPLQREREREREREKKKKKKKKKKKERKKDLDTIKITVNCTYKSLAFLTQSHYPITMRWKQ
jgi:hypothetical protein